MRRMTWQVRLLAAVILVVALVGTTLGFRGQAQDATPGIDAPLGAGTPCIASPEAGTPIATPMAHTSSEAEATPGEGDEVDHATPMAHASSEAEATPPEHPCDTPGVGGTGTENVEDDE